MGHPEDAETRQRFMDRDEYVAIVMEKESEEGLAGGYRLSSALQDSKRQYRAFSMRLYQRWKPEWFSKVLTGFSDERKGARCLPR